jgi:hypothetical protein
VQFAGFSEEITADYRLLGSLKETGRMRWNENSLRRAETVIAVVVVALILLAYLVSKVR